MSQRTRYRLAAGSSSTPCAASPFLLFAYIVYYGLPSFGITSTTGKPGWPPSRSTTRPTWRRSCAAPGSAQPREPIDAGYAFGFTGLRHFRRIVLPPLLLSAAPLVGNQVIQIIKDSAFLTVIALPELTHAASSIQSRHYVPFAAFITAVLLYWVLCLTVEAGVASIGRVAEARR